MTLHELVTQIACSQLGFQLSDGSMSTGHNGPYYDQETPVRNTGHWLITFGKIYQLTNEVKYKKAVQLAANYLASDAARPNQASFWHRKSTTSDKCNGLVGAAWTFEALVEASKVLEDSKYHHLAEEVFFQHSFNSKRGLWHRLEIDGVVGRIDQTVNHQLWFATTSSMLIGNSNRGQEIEARIKRFLDMLPTNMAIFDNGLSITP
jgi:hypothetical protein